MFDIAVIGNGMMGSAASRYLSATGQTVLAIGPGEPADWQAHQGVFASHYDQGRITRIIDPDPVWAHLAARSIAVYPEIEASKGWSANRQISVVKPWRRLTSASPSSASSTVTALGRRSSLRSNR